MMAHRCPHLRWVGKVPFMPLTEAGSNTASLSALTIGDFAVVSTTIEDFPNADFPPDPS